MNFLAHMYLSGDDPQVMVGNFLGDFVKGKLALESYDTAISIGIRLHRGIDIFTDTHAVVQQSKNRLRPKYRHYSGVIVDMFYDHFLGSQWTKYHHKPLEQFASEAYENLKSFESIMPDEARRVLPYIVKGNWLVSYASVDGIGRALSGMARRTTHNSQMEQASDDLVEHYEEFKSEFNLFFPELIAWSRNKLATNLPDKV